MKRYIVQGQKVDPIKLEAAKNLRRAMTEAEALLWQALRRNQCGGLHFRRQQVIDGFVVDFYCHAAGLVLELDGAIHARHRASDAARDAALITRGLRVLRIRNQDLVRDLPAVLERILEQAEE